MLRRNLFWLWILTMIWMGGQELFAQSGRLDVLYLKDGSVAVGKVREEIPGLGVKLVDEKGFERVFLNSDIVKREKTKGRLFEEEGGLKSPEWATVYSFLVPGCGQYYMKNYSKGAIMTAVWAASGAAVWASYENLRFERSDYGKATFGAKALFAGSILCYLGNGLYSMIDAYNSAERYNEQIRRKRMNLNVVPTSFIVPNGTSEDLCVGLSLRLQW